jgi:hypothetical protein
MVKRTELKERGVDQEQRNSHHRKRKKEEKREEKEVGALTIEKPFI